jgi:hypothetical protein
MPSHTFEFEFEYKEVLYSVVAEAEIGIEDESFDHEFGTEESYSCSLEDCSFSVVKVNEDESTEEVDENKIEGLHKALIEEVEDKVSSLDPSDFDFGSHYDWEEDDF